MLWLLILTSRSHSMPVLGLWGAQSIDLGNVGCVTGQTEKYEVTTLLLIAEFCGLLLC